MGQSYRGQQGLSRPFVGVGCGVGWGPSMPGLFCRRCPWSPNVWIPCVWRRGETREPMCQCPLCVWVIYGDQGPFVGFVMILWVSDAWVSCVCGISGAQIPGFFLQGGYLWGWDSGDPCEGGACGTWTPRSLANVLSPVGW